MKIAPCDRAFTSSAERTTVNNCEIHEQLYVNCKFQTNEIMKMLIIVTNTSLHMN